MRFAVIMYFTLFFRLTSSFAGDCGKLSFQYCAMNDVPSGSTRIEYDLEDCDTLKIRKYHTDYRCSTEGELLSSVSKTIADTWVTSNKVTSKEEGDIEYGSYNFKDKIYWNSEKTELTKIHNEENDLMNLDISSGKFYKKDEKRSKVSRITREGEEVVMRTYEEVSLKSKFTRDEWLKNTSESIEVFEPL